ncbi:MAG TPA: Ig-like domain-containing protein, partial [Chitinophagales bacterium]|nr:Ig-like domain-containing protein [Chitinophagales bacterium]
MNLDAKIFIFFLLVLTLSCEKDKEIVVPDGTLQLSSIQVGTVPLNLLSAPSNINMPVDQAIVVSFTGSLDTSSVSTSVSLSVNGNFITVNYSYSDGNKTFSAKPIVNLENNTTYQLQINNLLKGENGESFEGITVSFATEQGTLKIISCIASGKNLLDNVRDTDIDLNFSAVVTFDHPIDPSSIAPSVIAVSDGGVPEIISYSLSDSNKVLNVYTPQPLVHFDKYVLGISPALKGMNGFMFDGFYADFYTELDTIPKFPLVSDDA